MKRLLVFMIAGMIFFTWPVAATHAFDGTPDLVCAAIETFECDNAEGCRQGLPENINFPRFLKIDFKKKIIIDDRIGEDVRTTKIEKKVELDHKLILHGTEEGMGWSMVINRSNGDLTLSATDDQLGFIVFGACTPR